MKKFLTAVLLVLFALQTKAQLHFDDLDLKPKKFKPNKPTPINFVLAFMQYIWLTTGYKKGISQ